MPASVNLAFIVKTKEMSGGNLEMSVQIVPSRSQSLEDKMCPFSDERLTPRANDSMDE